MVQLHKFSRFGSIGKPLSFFNFSAFFYSTYGMAVTLNVLNIISSKKNFIKSVNFNIYESEFQFSPNILNL